METEQSLRSCHVCASYRFCTSNVDQPNKLLTSVQHIHGAEFWISVLKDICEIHD